MDVVRTLLFALCMTSFANVLSQETSPVQYPFDHPDSNPRGIFGTDGRKEIKDTEGFSEFARATAVLIPKEDLKGNRKISRSNFYSWLLWFSYCSRCSCDCWSLLF